MIRKIKKALPIFTSAIGAQSIEEGKRLRPFAFVVTLQTDEGELVYNVLTHQMVLLRDGTMDDVDRLCDDDRQRLAESWFLVPEDMDDKKTSDQFRGLMLSLAGHEKHDAITSYTIFTTTDCNARCYYCFELGAHRINMPEKVAHDTADYIVRHAKGQKVELTWFGGEPLYNISAIDTITADLIKAGVKYSAKMISNGYLFDDDMIRRAVDVWKLKWIQITLDGTEKIYNRSKRYIYKNVNPYQRVLENIRKLVDAGVVVSVRLNVSSKNGDDLLRLIDEIHDRYGSPKGLRMYTHILYDNTEGRMMTNDLETKRSVWDYRQRMFKKIQAYGYDAKIQLDDNVRVYNCMADDPRCVSVLPYGQFGKCEHYTDEHYVGSIYSEEFDKEALAEFAERIPLIPECVSCPIYPICHIPRLCGGGTTCTEFRRREGVQRMQRQMRNTYQSWKKWKAKKDGDDQSKQQAV